MGTDTYIDQTPFLSDRFDVNDYANAVLSGNVYRPDDPQAGSSTDRSRSEDKSGIADAGVELARLSYGIEDVTKQLRQEIANSYPLLLAHLTTSLSLSSHLAPIRSSLSSLSSSLDRLQTKIHTPYEHLSLLVRRQHLLALASDLTRRAARFVLVARRLEGQMKRTKIAPGGSGEGEKERELAKAALSVAELDALLKPPEIATEEGMPTESDPLPLDSLAFVQTYQPVVNKARDTIIHEMEDMVINGLADLNQGLMSSSLQTAHNLGLLSALVQNLLMDLNDAVTLRVQRAFDSAAIGREVAAKGEPGHAASAIKFPARGRNTTEPSSSNAQQWTNVLWARLEKVIEDIANCCIKVYTLEKVLRMKRDPNTQVDFLEEVMTTLDDKPSFMFWTTLAKAFEAQTKEVAKSSVWLQQALSNGYPRLLRLFHDFFAKIAVHTDTVYTREHQSPEAVLVLRSVSVFETLYLSRGTTRMNEAVTSALSQYSSARQTAPGPSDGVTIARTITNELDSAKFDPLLARTVARNAVKVLSTFGARLDAMIVRDFTATSLIGPSATPAQLVNAQAVGCLYHIWYNLKSVEHDFSGRVWDILKVSVDNFESSHKRITDALDVVIRREIGSALARIHKVDFAKPVDPMSMGNRGGSPYMQDVIDKLNFVKVELLGRMSLGDFMREWILDLSRYIIRTFLLHASIARPMGESGKLKLTGDMTELEMGIASLLSTGQVPGQRGGLRIEKVGDEYLALRGFRSILFAPRSSLSNPVETVHLPTLILLHHIIVLSSLLLPHEVHQWSETEYVLWVQKHEEEEQWGLLERAIDSQLVSKSINSDGEIEGEEEESVKLIREVLVHARGQQVT
ncbi:hypothetical protein M231_00045 [Tremella mesenterica]|uniref:Conserved oligomeric Golgi complex subunit 5 n=1 Tax=Tremella mesenterica TaxID=5217 RepID=A0A4Q1BWE7_TREME|nr:hypothetical protein M231_00045 [Tremella mesenterica]